MANLTQNLSFVSLFSLLFLSNPIQARTLVDWLNDEGARIFVIVGTSLILFIIWHILCILVIKALYVRGSRMRKNIILSRMHNQRNIRDYAKDQIPVVSVVEDDEIKLDDKMDDRKDDESGHTSMDQLKPQMDQLDSNNNNSMSTSLIHKETRGNADAAGTTLHSGTHAQAHHVHSSSDSLNDTANNSNTHNTHNTHHSSAKNLTKSAKNATKTTRTTTNSVLTRNSSVMSNISEGADSAGYHASLETNLDEIILPEDVKHGVRHRAETFGGVIRNFGTFFIIMITLLQILDTIDVATNSLLIATTLIGFSIALGFYTIISDFASGLFILAENQYFKGEFVIINGISGVVESQSLRLTTIRSRDGHLHTFGNGMIRKVTNCSRDYSIASVFVTIGYQSEDDYTTCKECLESIVSRAIKLDKTVDIVNYLEDPMVDGIVEMKHCYVTVKYSLKVLAGTELQVQQAMMKHTRIEFMRNGIQIECLQTPQSRNYLFINSNKNNGYGYGYNNHSNNNSDNGDNNINRKYSPNNDNIGLNALTNLNNMNNMNNMGGMPPHGNPTNNSPFINNGTGYNPNLMYANNMGYNGYHA